MNFKICTKCKEEKSKDTISFPPHNKKLDGLINTLVTVYQEFEGMKIDISNFKIVNWIHYAASEYLTDEQLEEILEFLVQTPGDTLCIPKHDCENVNFPLIAHFLSEKYKQADLSRYRLM